jgi:hypothetical protein
MGLPTISTVLCMIVLTLVASLTAALKPDAHTAAITLPAMQQVATEAATKAVENLSSNASSGEMVTVKLSIIDHDKFRLYCLAGASIGAIITALVSLVFQPNISHREFLIKLVVSFLVAISTSPMIIRYTRIPIDTDSVLFTSAMIGIVGWGVLVALKPIMERFIVRAAVAKFPVPPDDRK